MKGIELILVFFIYSFIGWLWESFLCSSVELNKIFNRGFLLGPYCPIYGIGASVSYLMLGNINSLFHIFLISAFTSCTIEYIIGFGLEKFFNQKWWNYENYPFHINGRVCLYGLIIFGSANIAIVKYLTPAFLIFLSLATETVLRSIASVFTFILLFDLLLTINHLKGSSDMLEEIYTFLVERNDDYFISLNKSDKLAKLEYLKESGIVKEKLEELNDNLKYKEKKIKKYKNKKILKIKNLFDNYI